MSEINVVTNSNIFSNCTLGHVKLNFTEIQYTNPIAYFSKFIRVSNYDFAIINIGSKELMLLCLLKCLLPFFRVKLISLDIILSKPTNISSYIVSRIKAILFKKVDYYILYMKDCSGYSKYYNIDANKFIYVPFKVNSYDYVMAKKTEDLGYIFTGGVSKRDYKTLFEAVRDLKYKITVLSPPNSICVKNGTNLYSTSIPENISIVHDNGSPESWIDFMAQAKLVVLPIKADTISPTGVSTYLVAMALKKCVIISEGPATRGIIPSDAAIIVPPENVNALRQAIIRACDDDEFRERVAMQGYKYATALKDQGRLANDIVDLLLRLRMRC